MARTTKFWIEGRQVVTGAAGSRFYDDLVRERGSDEAETIVKAALGRMDEVRTRFPEARGLQRFDVIIEALLLAAGVPDDQVAPLAARYRRSPGSEWDVVYDGTPEEVQAYLEARIDTDAFRVRDDGVIELRVPEVAKDRRPRPGGGSYVVEVQPIDRWGVQAPAVGGWWHAVPPGDAVALCPLDTRVWKGERRRDDTQAVTCPWCRLRLIAIELVAPPGPRRATETRVKLHDEIARILHARGNPWMSTQDLADAVNEAGRYRKEDDSSVNRFQIHGRTKNYPHLFERRGDSVRLLVGDGEESDEETRRAVLAAAYPDGQIEVVVDSVFGRRMRLAIAGGQVVKFAYLDPDPGQGVSLRIYPGDTLGQARLLYGTPGRAERLLGLRAEGWDVEPCFHFGYMVKGLTWTKSRIPVDEYVRYWVERIADLSEIRREDWEGALQSLIADGIFDPSDTDDFDRSFVDTKRQTASPRPSLEATRRWDAQAVQEESFPSDLRAALSAALEALGEPSPA